MSHQHLNPCPGAYHQKRSARRGVRHSATHRGGQARPRARIVASLLAASHVLPADPDAAALLLDGALGLMLDLWASGAGLRISRGAAALSAVEERSPAIAWRLRLALQAPSPEARLAHYWALIDLLTCPIETIPHNEPALACDPHTLNRHRSQSRKDDQSHVS